jgi:tetratricopeptide (TPR) repeat protein
MVTKIVALIATSALLLSASCNGTGCKSAEDCYNRGMVAQKAGDRTKAYRFLAGAAEDDPTNTTYQWAAAAVAPNAKFALFHIKTAWDNGLRNIHVFDAYVSLSSFQERSQKLDFALQLFPQLPDSVRTDEVRASLFFSFQRYDSAAAILRPLAEKKPTPMLCNMLSKSLLAKGDVEGARTVLMDGRKKKMLDAEGHLLLTYTYVREFDYPSIQAVFDGARKDGFYNQPMRLAHARIMVAQENPAEAQDLLRSLIQLFDGASNSPFQQEVRIASAYSYYLSGQRDSIEKIRSSVKDDSISLPEKELYALLIRKINDSAGFLDTLKPIIKRLPEYPELELLLAREISKTNKYNEALALYERLPETYLMSPRILVERARLLSMMGKDTVALALLGVMHQRKVSTKTSLELFRDITFKLNRIEDAQKAQKILSQLYKNDVSIRWAGGMLAMKSGKLDSALSIFSELSRSFPTEPRFKYARLFVYFLKGMYEDLFSESGKNKVSSPEIARLLARTFRKLNRNKEADSTYKAALTMSNNVGLKIEYAEFLTIINKASQAAQVYQEIINDKKAATGIDTMEYAAILNNLAWSLMQGDKSDKKLVLATIEKAYSLNSTLPSILDTYAEALLKYNDYSACIKVLEKSPLTRKETALLLRLSTAYEKGSDLNKAVRVLQDAEKLIESGHPGTISIPMDRQTIEARIKSILSRIKE